MNTQTTDPNSPNSASVKDTDGEQLTKLLATHRRLTSQLYAELRTLLAKEASVSMNPPPQSHTHRMQQLQKAFELYRQAEAKTEILVVHFGGSQ
jgi:hypothetical protein